MSALSHRRNQEVSEHVVLLGVVVLAIGVLLGTLLVPPAVLASDALDFVAGDVLDVGPLPEVEPPPENSFIYAADGAQLAEIRYKENRQQVSLDQIPMMLQQAVIATEDRNFYDHNGINLQAILRAGLSNVQAGEITSGASTITQQYVKNTFLAKRATEQSFNRKIVEAVWATQLEQRLTKDQILERYLNRIYFGSGAYGVAAAADRYFSKALDQLTLPETATLAATIRDPSGNDPLRNPAASRDRRDIVLGQMAAAGYITDQQRDVARATPLEPDASEIAPPNQPFWVDWITQQLISENTAAALGPGATEPQALMGATSADRIASVFQGGLNIYTTLNPQWQQIAEDSLKGMLSTPGESAAGVAQEPIGGIVSVEPGSGAVRTMAIGPQTYGSCQEDDNYAGTDGNGVRLCDKTKFNPLVPGTGGRQPGSSFKPFVIAAALESGLSPGWTTDAREGQTLEGCGQPGMPYAPKNAGGGGFRNMYTGIKFSVNVFHAKLAREIGPPTVQDMAGRLGLRNWTQTHEVGSRDCSIGLGATEVKPLEMASAYATIANEGEYCPPYAIERIESADGKLLYEHSPDCQEVVNTDIMDRLIDIMEGPVTPGGTAEDMQARMEPYPVRGKTGTTDDSRDAWFVGFVKQLATATWIGYPNGERTYATEGQATAACPTYHDGRSGGGNPADFASGVAKCPAVTRVMQDVTIGGNAYDRVYGGTIPAPIWGDYMTQVVQGFDPVSFPDPGPIAGTAVPDLRGVTTIADAQRIIEESGLNFRVRRVKHFQPAGTIVGQSPGAGAQVQVGSLVFLEISDGTGDPTMPPEGNGFLPDPSASPSPGLGSPSPGGVPGQILRPPALTVFDVTGLNESLAVSRLEASGFRVTVFRQATDDPNQVGIVLSQTPEAEQQTPPGGTVVIQVGALAHDSGGSAPPSEPSERPRSARTAQPDTPRSSPTAPAPDNGGGTPSTPPTAPRFGVG